MSNQNQNRNQDRVFINRSIKSPKVLCIGADNTNLGVIPLNQAISLASEAGMDLVQVAPPQRDNPPTCKILDYGKYKYELSKKKKASDKKQRETAIKVKEIKFHPTTDEHDLRTKARQAEEFIAEGHKIKVSVVFNKGGRQFSHKDVALDTFNKFIEFLPPVQKEGQMVLEGKALTVIIVKRDL